MLPGMRVAPAFHRRPPFFFALLACICISACGAPGVPTPPRPLTPKPVTDLAARQQGATVILTFTLPKKSDENQTLAALPSIEIFRGERTTGAAAKFTPQLIFTVPSAQVDTYVKDGLIEFRDPLKPDSLHGQEISYLVRTRASIKRASADSNLVSVRTLPVPPAPIGVRVTAITETSIALGWTAPHVESANGGGIGGYRVYRGELPADATPRAGETTDILKLKLSVPLALLGPAAGNSFRDTEFRFGINYVYVVRSVADEQGQPVESSDSAALTFTPKDIFAPAAPQRLIAIPIRDENQATGAVAGRIELSWDINQEPDLAGYWIYRSEQPGTRGERINTQLLLTPTFRDTTAMPGKQYTYRVTAVDRSGNESSSSSPVTAAVPQNER
jgi:hypothetical protein